MNNPVGSPNVLTVLHAPGLRKAKLWAYDAAHLDGDGNPEPLWIAPYELGDPYLFPEQRTVTDIRAAFAMLRELQGDPHRFLVWGALRNAADAQTREGVGIEDKRKGYSYRPGQIRCAKVYLERQSLNLVMFDLDKVRLGAPVHDETSARAAVCKLRSAMPEAFRNATCVAQFSGSSGHPARSTDVIGVHLFFWLRHAADVDQLKAWMLTRTDLVVTLNADHKVFQVQQPIYTANRVKAADWMPDLLGLGADRVLLVEGASDVVEMAPLPPAGAVVESLAVDLPDDENETCGLSDEQILADVARFYGADLWRANDECAAVADAAARLSTSGRSEADFSRAQKLLWATCGNVTQTLRIMHAAPYARADAWAGKDNWIVRACVLPAYSDWQALRDDKKRKLSSRMGTADFQFGQQVPPAPEASIGPQVFAPPTARVIEGTSSYATRDDQRKLFKGCVLIVNNDGGDPVILMPGGMRLKRRQFEAKFAGPDYLLGGPKNKATDSAWEAFTRSQDTRFPRADRPAFRPRDPFQTIYAAANGESAVNTYLPRGVFKAGDPTPFVDHLRKILPRGEDALILTSFLAACVQHVGRKFTWAIVLVSPAEGTGKGLISRVMATALGQEYVARPKAKSLLSNFNRWMREALLVCVDDMPASASEELLETLKPMITDGEGATIEGKGADQVSVDVFCNWLFTSNHKDGIRKTANDRRYCMLYCAQNDADDLARDGMGEEYFTRFANWLQHSDGRAIAAEYLRAFEIPERYDPTRGAVRAPNTSSTAEALAAGRDELSQILAEHLADGTPGFRDDWVSHGQFAAYASEMRNRPGRVKLARTLEAQGYVRCPGLVDGRTNDPVPPDGRKTVLWVKKGSRTLASLAGKAASEIQRMYVAAQAEKYPANASTLTGSSHPAGLLPAQGAFGVS